MRTGVIGAANRQIMKLVGWKRTRVGTIEFHKCPSCAHCSEILRRDADGLAVCDRCSKHFDLTRFRKARQKRIIAVCGLCGADVPLTPAYEGGLGHFCPKCDNYVAFRYGHHFLHPATILRLQWNESARARAVRLPGGLRFALCRSARDYLVVTLLGVFANAEDSRFMTVRKREHRAGLLFISRRRKYAGFLVWTENEKHAVLRQIFIVPAERRGGRGKTALRYWVETFADRISPEFGVESPNERGQGLLVSLGYARWEGKQIVGHKCYFVRGM